MSIDLQSIAASFNEQISKHQFRIMICAGTGCMANGSMEVYERFLEVVGERGLSAIWVCNFVENATSARAKDKLGFELVRLEEATNPVTGVVRTQQVSVLTKSSWENMQKTTE